ncbi:hypothetical protein [Sphingomonas sp. PAMC 26605]|uniref:hypothetical protein n=1 Tax=Sphingomonas sp. PAMC 26605 TaxID=1112214 RepID=UPI0006866694|nr:hypothetical protein [Sphingomonas sp. PAMC 26605]
MTDKEIDNNIEVWKTIIGVQQHFNELEMRIRNVAVTVLAAFLGAAGYTLKEGLHVRFGSNDISLTGLVLIAGTVCWLCFYGMDRAWYHRLLKGAVLQGMRVEDALSADVPGIRLTYAIGEASPIKVLGLKIGSNARLDAFYLVIAGLLLSAAAMAFIQKPTPISLQHPSAKPTSLPAGKPAVTQGSHA